MPINSCLAYLLLEVEETALQLEHSPADSRTHYTAVNAERRAARKSERVNVLMILLYSTIMRSA